MFGEPQTRTGSKRGHRFVSLRWAPGPGSRPAAPAWWPGDAAGGISAVTPLVEARSSSLRALILTLESEREMPQCWPVVTVLKTFCHVNCPKCPGSLEDSITFPVFWTGTDTIEEEEVRRIRSPTWLPGRPVMSKWFRPMHGHDWSCIALTLDIIFAHSSSKHGWPLLWASHCPGTGRIHSLHIMELTAALSAVKGMRLYRRALELVRVGHKASLRKNEKESFTSWVWRMFQKPRGYLSKSLKKELGVLEMVYLNGVEWNEQGRVCWKMRLGARQELGCRA